MIDELPDTPDGEFLLSTTEATCMEYLREEYLRSWSSIAPRIFHTRKEHKHDE